MLSEFDRGVVSSLSFGCWALALIVSGINFGFPMVMITMLIMLHMNFESAAK